MAKIKLRKCPWWSPGFVHNAYSVPCPKGTNRYCEFTAPKVVTIKAYITRDLDGLSFGSHKFNKSYVPCTVTLKVADAKKIEVKP